MKRLSTLLLVLVVACHRGGTTGVVTGESSPEAAVNAFIAAAKAQDLQAMSRVWGDAKGPVRDDMDREQLEMRELIMMRVLCQETSRVVSTGPGMDSRRIVRVELKRPNNTLIVNFTTAQASTQRWFVEDFDMSRLVTFCR